MRKLRRQLISTGPPPAWMRTKIWHEAARSSRATFIPVPHTVLPCLTPSIGEGRPPGPPQASPNFTADPSGLPVVLHGSAGVRIVLKGLHFPGDPSGPSSFMPGGALVEEIRRCAWRFRRCGDLGRGSASSRLCQRHAKWINPDVPLHSSVWQTHWQRLIKRFWPFRRPLSPTSDAACAPALLPVTFSLWRDDVSNGTPCCRAASVHSR